MDLNSQDSFYSNFDNCGNSSVGIETIGSKENQDIFMEAERQAPVQFNQGEPFWYCNVEQQIRLCTVNCGSLMLSNTSTHPCVTMY